MSTKTQNKSWIVESYDEICLYENVSGGKGSSLADLVQQEYNVPYFFILSNSAYNLVENLADLKRFYSRLATLKIFQTRRILQISKEIQQAILAVELPKEFRNTVYRHAKTQSDFNSWRSSMVGEDSVSLSYAGVLRTELFVNLQAPSDVDKVYLGLLAEAFSIGAINYRIQNNASHEISLPIVVQKQIDSDAGVVYFGQNQVSTEKSLLSACYGQCEAIVSNQISAYRYEADNHTFDIKLVSNNAQLKQLRPNFETRELEWVEISADLASMAPLPDFVLQQIVKFGQQEAQRKGGPRDMEFSITFENNEPVIWVLQSRPVTKKIVSDLGPEDNESPVLARGIPTSPGIYYGQVITPGSIPESLKPGCIFLGEEFAPIHDWTLGSISAIIADTGDDASHAAAKGHEFNIPVVLSAKNSDGVPISQLLKAGDEVTIDGYYGIIYSGKSDIRVNWSQELPPQNSINQDGLKTKLVVNCSFVENVQEAVEQGAKGIGLLRGDFLIPQFPLSYIGGSENTGIQAISERLISSASLFYEMWLNSQHKHGEVVYRTFGPKLHEMRDKIGSEPWHNTLLKNHRDPSTGLQGVSLSLHPLYIDAFIMELQAFKKAWEQYPNLVLMFPVIRSQDDCYELVDILTEVGLNNKSRRPKRLMMCELGINFTQPESFLCHFDGASIGGNDSRLSLTLLNRDGSEASHRYNANDPLLIQTYCDYIVTCVRLGKSVSFCGNLPSSNPEICKQFVQAGITSISVGTHALPAAEKVVRETEKLA